MHEAEFSRFALRRLAYRTRPNPAQDTRRGTRPEWARAVLATLEASGIRLQEQLLAAAADELGGGPLVLVPPAPLHPLPSGVVPALAHPPVTVSPPPPA